MLPLFLMMQMHVESEREREGEREHGWGSPELFKITRQTFNLLAFCSMVGRSQPIRIPESWMEWIGCGYKGPAELISQVN